MLSPILITPGIEYQCGLLCCLFRVGFFRPHEKIIYCRLDTILVDRCAVRVIAHFTRFRKRTASLLHWGLTGQGTGARGQGCRGVHPGGRQGGGGPTNIKHLNWQLPFIQTRNERQLRL